MTLLHCAAERCPLLLHVVLSQAVGFPCEHSPCWASSQSRGFPPMYHIPSCCWLVLSLRCASQGWCYRENLLCILRERTVEGNRPCAGLVFLSHTILWNRLLQVLNVSPLASPFPGVLGGDFGDLSYFSNLYSYLNEGCISSLPAAKFCTWKYNKTLSGCCFQHVSYLIFSP